MPNREHLLPLNFNVLVHPSHRPPDIFVVPVTPNTLLQAFVTKILRRSTFPEAGLSVRQVAFVESLKFESEVNELLEEQRNINSNAAHVVQVGTYL